MLSIAGNFIQRSHAESKITLLFTFVQVETILKEHSFSAVTEASFIIYMRACLMGKLHEATFNTNVEKLSITVQPS